MDADLRHAVERLASRQHGAVSRSQMLALGVSRHAIAHAALSGRHQRVFPAVYVLGQAPLARKTLASAALLFVGPDAALARRSALALNGLFEWPDLVEVMHPRSVRLCDPRIVLHRTRRLDERDVEVVDGLACATPLRALLDAADDLDPIALADLAAKATRLGKVSRSQLTAVLAWTPRDPYTKALRQMMAVPGAADSGVEVHLATALQGTGLDVVINGEIRLPNGRRRRGDIVIHSARLVIQIDSDAFHTGDRADADMRRDADWAEAGYRVYRVSPRRIRRELLNVVDEIVRIAHSVTAH